MHDAVFASKYRQRATIGSLGWSGQDAEVFSHLGNTGNLIFPPGYSGASPSGSAR